MSNKDFELSRRKALAALGSIGVASAGAGLGTSAYFSDQETFENNRLVAGELDLKMDWEEHYSDWSEDEAEDPTGGQLDIQMEEPEEIADYTRYPPGVTDETEGLQSVWVADGDVPQFQANTAIEAFPDDNDDGVASYDDLVTDEAGDAIFPGNDTGDLSPTACDILADVGANDGGLSSDARTNGTIGGQTTNSGDPLINLQDVKPGDFGEVTFSTHLCDNDGYLWINAPGGLTESENGVTEPEADDSDEDQIEGSGNPSLKEEADEGEGKTVELPDKIRTSLWYDNNCDNVPQESPEPVDLIVIADTSASITDSGSNNQLALLKGAADAFAEELPSGDLTEGQRAGEEIVRVGLMSFAGGEALDTAVTLEATVGPVDQFLDGSGNGIASDFLPDETAGNTPMPGALDIARKILNDDSLPGVRGSDVDKKILLVTDGGPNYEYSIIEEPLPDANDFGAQYSVDYGGTSIESENFTAGAYPENDDNTIDQNNLFSAPSITESDFHGSDGFPDGSAQNTSSDEERLETANLAADINNDTPNDNDNDGMDILVAGIANEANVGLGDALDSYLQMYIASTPNDFYDTNFSVDLRSTARQIARDVAAGGSGEEYIFQGITLRNAIDLLTQNGGRGLPLDGNRSTVFDEIYDDENAETRECFDASATHCFGFSWWLPLDHGNEVQSDSASFDIGFYTEQCRHNDGAGMNDESVDA